MPKSEQTQGSQFEINYAGMYADRLSWNRRKLARFSQIADLRTTVEIRNTDQQPKSQFDIQGDTIALKRFVDPLSLFTKPPQLDEEYSATYDPMINHSEILIHDQAIYNNLTRNNKQPTLSNFAQRLNFTVANSLYDLTIREKGLLTTASSRETIPHIRMALFEIAALALIMNGYTNTVNSDSKEFLGRYMQSFGLSEILIGGALVLGKTLEYILNFKEEGYGFLNQEPQYRSGWDHVPLKHIANFMMGKTYLSTAGYKIVSPTKQPRLF